MQERKPRRVHVFSDQELREDLGKYRQSALNLGAIDAAVLRGEQIHVDSRVRIKCSLPKCPEYGSSAHCPPHALEPDKVRELVSAFRWGLLVKLDVPADIVAGEGDVKIDPQGKIIPNPVLKTLLNSYRKLNEIVTSIESEAFYDGHYLATAFAAGSCHAAYCNFQECQVLKQLPCRFPLKARSSMEGSSMDVFRMAAEADWEIYPIGMDCPSGNVPHGSLVGLVLID